MARVFLVNPPSPEPVRTPLLSFCHLAASLRAGGHEVALLDASAPFAPHDARRDRARGSPRSRPISSALHLKTLHVQPAYALARRRSPTFALVAGGPHATIVPDEPLAHGFRWRDPRRGRGGAGRARRRRSTASARVGRRRRAVVARSRHGAPQPGAAVPHRARSARAAARRARSVRSGLVRRAARALPPAGLLSSRGCPAGVHVLLERRHRPPVPLSQRAVGRRRGRAAARAVRRCSRSSFFDDSFAVGRRRVARAVRRDRRRSARRCGGPAPRTRRTSIATCSPT